MVDWVHDDLGQHAWRPAAVVSGVRERLAGLAEVLWAAKSAEELVAVNAELERVRSAIAAVQARVGVEIDATDAAKTAGGVGLGG